MVEQANRIKADILRKNLVKGYPQNSRFYKLVYALTDAEIVEAKVAHDREVADHQSLLALYRQRVAQEPKPQPSQFAKLSAAALAVAR